MKLIALLLFGLAAPGVALSSQRTKFYEGTTVCSGPFNQPQLGLPSDHVRIRISWDPLFRSSDVQFRLGQHEETAPAIFYVKHSHPAGPMDPDALSLRTFFQGNIKLERQSYWLIVHHGVEGDSHSPINQGMLKGDHGWLALHCRTEKKG